MRKACEDAAAASELFFEEGLHGYYARVSGNSFLEHLYQRVMALLNVLYIQGLLSCDDEIWKGDYRKKHHDEELYIVEAISAKDLEQLQLAITTHVNNFRDFLIDTLERWSPNGLNWNVPESSEPGLYE
jgi:DNA-binding GntR family transcriptional regulator